MKNKIEKEQKPVNVNLTVGVLLDSVNSYFNHRAIVDLLDAAEEYGIKLIFYFGGILEKNKTAGTYSYAYTLPDSCTVQSLIVFPNLISPFNPESSIQVILDQFPNIPIYSCFKNLSNYHSVWVNETNAIQTMLHHLVVDHSYKKFSLLCGYDSPESLSHERQKAIIDILQTYKISVDPSLIFPGTFLEEDGKTTASKILELNTQSPEVLICMNDQMAIGTIKEFIHHGRSVPEEMAIVGFDDVEENASLPCAFTSINSPVWQTISLTISRIFSDLTGKTKYNADKIELEAQFMHRESCGCTSYFEKKIQNETSFIPLELRRSSHSALKKAAILRRSLEDVIEECIKTNITTSYTAFIQYALNSLSHSGDLTNSFIDTFITQWTTTLLRHQDFQTQVFINSLFVDTFRILLQHKTDAFSRVHSNDLGSLAFYRSCNDLLADKISLNEAIKGIGSNLPALGIKQCTIVFICPEEPRFGEIRLSYKHGQYTEIPVEPFVRFPINYLLDNGMGSIQNPIGILTIAHNNTIYGYLLLSITEKHFEQFDMIQKLISTIIDSAMTNDLLSTHIQSLTTKNDALSRLSLIDEFTGLYNRRALYMTGKNMYQTAIETSEPSGFIFIDMDGLKKINDTFGHQEGDTAILALADVLKRSFREKDLVVRYGGDEFVVLMIRITEDLLQKALIRINTEIAAFNDLKQKQWVLSASWGYVYNTPSSTPKSFDSIIKESDAKLYDVKRKKRLSSNT